MTKPSENSASFDWLRWFPWLLFAFAFGLRLAGIGWGLPDAQRHWSYHPDEPVNLAYARQIEVGAGDFDPGFYNYGTLFLTITSIADDVVGGYRPVGEQASREDIAAHDARTTRAGRIVNAAFGAGTAVLVFLMLRRFQPPLASAIGAIAVAVAPGHVVHSRFLTVDVSAAFWTTACLYAALRILPATMDGETGPKVMKWCVLGGLFAGLAAGTKYNGALVIVAPLAAIFLAKSPNAWLKATASIATAGIAFLLSTPGVLTNTAKFKEDFAYELTHSRSGHGLVFEGLANSFFLHVGNLLVGVGLLVVVLALAGSIMGIRAKSHAVIVVGIFAILYYVMIGQAELAFLRYTFPLIACIGFGLGWFVGSIQANEKLGRVMTAVAILAVGGLPFGDSLMSTGRWTAAMAGTDSRDAVLAYFRSLKESEISVGLVADPWFYSPSYYPDATAPRFVPADFRVQAMQVGPFNSPARPQMYVPANEPKHDWDVRLLTESKPDYVAFSSFEASDLHRLAGGSGWRPEIQLQVDRYKAFVKSLEEHYEPAYFAGFPRGSVHDMEYVRPQMWVWKRKTSN